MFVQCSKFNLTNHLCFTFSPRKMLCVFFVLKFEIKSQTIFIFETMLTFHVLKFEFIFETMLIFYVLKFQILIFTNIF